MAGLLALEKTNQANYRKKFDCAEPSLNDFLQKYARKSSEGDISQTHILFDDQQKKIISYYSICNCSIQKNAVASQFAVPVREIPATLIGRLAVDKSYKGRGCGTVTLAEALKQIRALSKIIGIKIVVVDALNEAAVGFYQQFGFIKFDDDPMRLFMKVAEIDTL